MATIAEHEAVGRGGPLRERLLGAQRTRHDGLLLAVSSARIRVALTLIGRDGGELVARLEVPTAMDGWRSSLTGNRVRRTDPMVN